MSASKFELPSLFAQEYAAMFEPSAAESFLTSEDATQKINEALIQGSSSKLTRIFNNWEPSASAVQEAYNNTTNQEVGVEEQTRQVVLHATKGLFNDDMTDLNASVINSLGDENYKNCLLTCYREREKERRTAEGEDITTIKTESIFPPKGFELHEDPDLKKKAGKCPVGRCSRCLLFSY